MKDSKSKALKKNIYPMTAAFDRGWTTNNRKKTETMGQMHPSVRAKRGGDK